MNTTWRTAVMLMTTICLVCFALSSEGAQEGNDRLPAQGQLNDAPSFSAQPAPTPSPLPIWFFLHLLKHLLVLCLPLGLLLWGVLVMSPYRIPPALGIWSSATIITTGSILYVTLAPGSSSKGINLLPFREIVRGLQSFSAQSASLSTPIPLWCVVNLLGNLVLFLPLGFVLMGFLSCLPRRVPPRLVTLIGCLLSIGIEVMQLAIPTRATDIDDVIFNTVGMGLGVMCFFVMQNLRQRRDFGVVKRRQGT